MDWVRLWHDMPNDPKWRLIAKKAERPIPEVVSVYLNMLVNASENEDRGMLSGWDDELVALSLDIEPEAVEAIRHAMEGRVLSEGVLTGWDKRQPKRNDDSRDRVRKYREKKKAEESEGCNESQQAKETDNEGSNGDVTHCNAQNRTEQNRTETEKEDYDASDDAPACDREPEPDPDPEPKTQQQPEPDPEPPKHLTKAEFEDFWAACRENWFGKPGAKQEALTQFCKIKRGDVDPKTLTDMAFKDCTQRWGQHHREGFAEAMKHVCRWLKNRCWEDMQENPASSLTSPRAARPTDEVDDYVNSAIAQARRSVA